jgi:hypothetical protein
MNHTEAVDQMAAERYLLNELTSDARNAFEEHAFDCAECAVDLRAGALFVQEAKDQLPGLASSQAKSGEKKTSNRRGFSFFLWRPAFAVPAMAALLVVVGYQNFVTFPALRRLATEPQVAPMAALRPSARGASRPTFTADRVHGLALPIDLVTEPGQKAASSYSFELRDAQGRITWTGTLPAPQQESDSDQSFSLTIPGGMLRNGSYSLTVTSVTAQGDRIPVEQYNFDIVVNN